MKKKGLILIGLLLFVAMPIVYAQNTSAGSDNGNSVTAGNENAGSENGNSDTTSGNSSQELKDLRVIIRTQAQELTALRIQLQAKIVEQKQVLTQYRNQESLTTEQRAEVKAMIQTMSQFREQLNQEYQNATKALNSYRIGAAEDKVAALNGIIESQQARKTLLTNIINSL